MGNKIVSDRKKVQVRHESRGVGTVGFRYDIVYLTSIGLTPGGNSTVHIYTQTINRTSQPTKKYIEQHNSLIRKSAGRDLSLRGIPWHLPYN